MYCEAFVAVSDGEKCWKHDCEQKNVPKLVFKLDEEYLLKICFCSYKIWERKVTLGQVHGKVSTSTTFCPIIKYTECEDKKRRFFHPLPGIHL